MIKDLDIMSEREQLLFLVEHTSDDWLIHQCMRLFLNVFEEPFLLVKLEAAKERRRKRASKKARVQA